MRVNYLFSGSKWAILESLAKQAQSTSELAKELKTSQANISQQLKQLELAGLIKRRRAQQSNKHYLYSIDKPYTHVVHVGPGIAQQQTRTASPYQNLLSALYTHKHASALITAIFGNPDLFSHANAIGILRRKQPEILVLAENVDSFRENASQTITTIDGKQQIAIWSHTPKELMQGIANKEEYYLSLLEETNIAYDPEGELETIHKTIGKTNE